MSAGPGDYPPVNVQLPELWMMIAFVFMGTVTFLQVVAIGVLTWIGFRLRKSRSDS